MSAGSSEQEPPKDRLRRAAQGPELSTAGLSIKGRSAIGCADGLRPPLTPSLSGRAAAACGGGDSTRHPRPGPEPRHPNADKERRMTSTAARATSGHWQHGALCREVDAETFFPTAESGRARARQEHAARAVCMACPVLEQCREWALTSLADGIAGGMTAEERRTERGRRARAERQARAARPNEQVGEMSAVAPAPTSEISRSHGQARTRVTEGHRA
ncbi:WhiB family transcriptional regulator [Actinomycetes bacterium KLBMP 9759]